MIIPAIFINVKNAVKLCYSNIVLRKNPKAHSVVHWYSTLFYLAKLILRLGMIIELYTQKTLHMRRHNVLIGLMLQIQW
jgi:hypothetical protein